MVSHVGPSSNTSRHVTKPPEYEGKTSWETYFAQFEPATNANAWSNAQKATALIVALRGTPLETLQSLPSDQRSDCAAIVRRMEMTYSHSHMTGYN